MPATTEQKLMAAMSFNAYRPSDENRIPIPDWEIDEDPEFSTSEYDDGFDAVVYKSSTGQIVVAFRGTDGLLVGDWWNGNNPAATGAHSDQVAHAIEIVADVLAKYPTADVQFTGHSLGGGLASLMSVFFNRPAYIFAPAPFEHSVTDRILPKSEGLQWANLMVERYFADYCDYQRDKGRPSLIDQSFQSYAAASGNHELTMAMFAQREQQVAGTFIRGEILENSARALFPTVVADGALEPIEIGDTTLSNPINLLDATTLHGMLLHAALVTSDDLRLASTRLPSLLELMVDDTLYAQDNASNIPGFLNVLVKRELATGTGEGQLDAFAQDLLRLGTTGSTHIHGLQEGLISAAVERYYELPNGSAPPFFQEVSGGIRFDVSPLEGTGADRGLQRLVQSVFALPLSSLEDRLIARGKAVDAEEWTVQVGDGGLVTDGIASNEVQIGSSSVSNELNGADGHDLLVGGVSADLLTGGTGKDVLLGGAGFDDLRGGDGQDYLSGGSGNDRLVGGADGATANRLDFVNFTNGEVSADAIDTLVNGGGGSFTFGGSPPPMMAIDRPSSGKDAVGRWQPIKEFMLPAEPYSDEYALATTSSPKAREAAVARRWQPIKDFAAPQVTSNSSAVMESAIDRLVSAMATFGEERSVTAIDSGRESGFEAQIAAMLQANVSHRPHLLTELRSLAE